MEKAKKILITGSSGMLGYALCQKLSNRYDLFGIDLLENSDARLPQERFFKVDITNRGPLLEHIIKISPDAVIHTAGYTDVDASQADPDKAYKINSLGAENVAFACKEADAFLFYLSTDYVFDGAKNSPYREDDLPNPINIYGSSKLKGEIAVKENLERYVIVRTSWLFGPKGKNFVDTVLKISKDSPGLSIVSDQVGSPTYTLDLASAIGKLLALAIGEKSLSEIHNSICHITNSGYCSWYELAQKILMLKKIEGVRLKSISSSQLNSPAPRPKMSILDNSRYYNLTGTRLRNWQDALSEFLS